MGAVILFVVPVVIGIIAWFAIHGMDLPGLNRSMIGLFGIGLQSAGELLVILFLLLVLPGLAKSSLQDLGFRLPSAGSWGRIGIAIIAMFLLVTIVGSVLSSALHYKSTELAIAVFMHMQGWQKALFAIFAVIVGPVWEEFVFRIFLFNGMRRWWGLWPGAIVSSALFGLAHAQPPFTGTMLLCLSLPLAVGGLVLCWVYTRTGSAYANILTHATFNVLSLVMISVAPQLAK